MIERPILFSAPMVRAILDGSKTQTRRVVKPQPIYDGRFAGNWKIVGKNGHEAATCSPLVGELCPHGRQDDRLWVRETFYAFGRWETRFSAKKGRDEWHFVDMTLESGKAYLYPASDSQPQPMGGKRHKVGVTPTWWKRPAIFMPSAASRISLEITGVRVERLQDISEDDALAEGCSSTAIVHEDGEDYTGHYASEEYQDLWESINGPGSWDANPWVWVIESKRLDQKKESQS
jgi:hypothetical protein